MLARPYRPRRPTESVLYAVVRDWLQTFLARARKTYDAPLPRYVEHELRGYLRCGVFAHGFVRAHCDTCGHDLLVAFSCKARAVCPSCAGRVDMGVTDGPYYDSGKHLLHGSGE